MKRGARHAVTEGATHVRTVFVSYAREDEEVILPIVHLLRAGGVLVFVDQEDIPYGEKWEAELLSQLRASERILVFWSINAAKSEWVRREYLIAIRAGLRVVPVPLDETPLPQELTVFQALTALVPLIHRARQARLHRARRISPRAWSRPTMHATAVFVAASLVLLQLTFSSPVAAEAGDEARWHLVVILGLMILVAIGSITIAFRKRVLVRKRVSFSLRSLTEQALQRAIYDSVFGETASMGFAQPEPAGVLRVPEDHHNSES